ncbi:uncharacterized protein [Ptychodera flava]|uniref:uncharacterized protein n=1 Tax=Ptychodera flava TaxID=63121 RepID=UPI00396A29E8
MNDRATIAEIFLELTGAQFNRAKGFLADNDVPAGVVDDVIYADDMARLIRSHFKKNEQKKLILDILKKIRAHDVIEKFHDFLNAKETLVGGVKSGRTAATLDARKVLFHRLGSEISADEQRMTKMLLGNQLTKRELEKLRNFTELLAMLEEKGYFEEDFELLKDVFKELRRPKLIRIVEEHEKEMAK